MGDNEERAQRAAEEANKRGWYLLAGQLLVAVNPDNSSEIWAFYHEDNVWRRKGEQEVTNLRQLPDEESGARDVDEIQELRIALFESLKLQRNYAELLNMHDGGQRIGFGTVQEWLARLRDVGKLPEGKPYRPRLEHMTEPELAEHMNNQLRFIKSCQTEDTIGSMLVIFQEDNITQYGATVDPETVPQALRELADRIEHRETVKRGSQG